MANAHPVQMEGVDGMVIVQYLGRNFGYELYDGAGRAPKRYRFSASKSKLYVPEADAVHLVKTYWQDEEAVFRIVPQAKEVIPAPTMESLLVDGGEAPVVDGDEEAPEAPVVDGDEEAPEAPVVPLEVVFPSVIGHSVAWIEKEVERGDKSAEILTLMLGEEEATAKPRKSAIKVLNAAIADAIAEAIVDATEEE